MGYILLKTSLKYSDDEIKTGHVRILIYFQLTSFFQVASFFNEVFSSFPLPGPTLSGTG